MIFFYFFEYQELNPPNPQITACYINFGQAVIRTGDLWHNGPPSNIFTGWIQLQMPRPTKHVTIQSNNVKIKLSIEMAKEKIKPQI